MAQLVRGSNPVIGELLFIINCIEKTKIKKKEPGNGPFKKPLSSLVLFTLQKTSVIYLFRNDLRIHDNECLKWANDHADYVVPLFCFDPGKPFNCNRQRLWQKYNERSLSWLNQVCLPRKAACQVAVICLFICMCIWVKI